MPPSGGTTEMPAKMGNSLTTSTAQAHANMGEGETAAHCGGRAPATTQLALYAAPSLTSTVSGCGAPPFCAMLVVTSGEALVRSVLPTAFHFLGESLVGCLNPQSMPLLEALRRRRRGSLPG